MRDLSAVIALFVASFIAGGILVLMIDDEPSVDPVAAYCRAYTDGVAKVLIDEGRLTQSQYLTEAPIVDELCIADLLLDEPIMLANLRGPLAP